MQGCAFKDLNIANLDWLYEQLNTAYGELGWWPAQSRFEMIIGAVLVQNTAWGNVEKAIANLRERGWLDIDSIHQSEAQELAAAIRPAGYLNVKAARLKNLCDWWLKQGDFATLDSWSTADLRRGLLAVNGIGPETADDILLYAFKRPVFVIDAYTRRILSRLGWLPGKPAYEIVRGVFESTLPQDSQRYGQYHALIVEHAKQHCQAKPKCEGCPLFSRCNYGQMNE